MTESRVFAFSKRMAGQHIHFIPAEFVQQGGHCGNVFFRIIQIGHERHTDADRHTECNTSRRLASIMELS